MSDAMKSAEERARELEARVVELEGELSKVRTLIDSPRNIMLFSFDTHYHYITYNEAHRQFVRHNWGVEIYPGMNVLDILSTPEERASARANFDRALRGESYILKRRYKKPKGETGFYENTYIPIVQGEEIVGVTIFAHDITEWSEKEQEGRKYRSIFDKALEGIFRSTPQGRFIEANREMARILGYESPQDLMESITDIANQLYCDPKDRETVFSILRNASVIKDFETRMFRKDGTEIWVEFNSRCERDDEGRVKFVEGKLTDITARKDAERKAELRRQQAIQADKMASLGVLVAGVGHEINNPNSHLTLNLPLLRDVWKDALHVLDASCEESGNFVLGGLEYSEIREQLPFILNEMIDASGRINEIVSRLKDYSRQSPEDEREYVDLNGLVRDGMTFVNHQIKQCSDKFDLTLSKDAVLVECNPQRLTQVLINLLLNACEALPSSGGTITVNVGRYFDSGDERACVEVRDNGAGISQTDLSYIQDPFFTTKREQGGTGLGLSISSTIMKEHGGRLAFDSEQGVGTTARMLLPVA